MVNTLPPETERQLAVDLFNYVWNLLDKPDRTTEENDQMLHAAHASRYHWGNVGEPVNFARGEWQISRVYSILKRAEPAQFHAQRSLAICIANNIGDFDLAFAYEALARAAMIAGDEEETHRYLELARAAGAGIAEEDDKQIFEADLATINPAESNTNE
jgi:hypothetical protein